MAKKKKKSNGSKKTKELKCKPGSFPVVVEIDKQKMLVCARFPALDMEKAKKRRRMWGYGLAALQALGIAIRAVAGHHQ